MYPPIEPYHTKHLKVSDKHSVYFEEAGNSHGHAALFLHGGPGVGVTPENRRFFNPDSFRIVLLDQRGAGRSTPFAETESNTTWDLVNDLEKLREHLSIDSWLILGGSWGSTLALCYAIKHPDRVTGLVLRGVFLARPSEIAWLYDETGAARVFPDEWVRFSEGINDTKNIVADYHSRLSAPDTTTAISAARAWTRWEASMNTIFPDETEYASLTDERRAVAMARLESHYVLNSFFLPEDNYILDSAAHIDEIPCRIIQGRYDMIFPPKSAWDLHLALRNSELSIIPDGAHSAMDTSMCKAIIAALDSFR